MKTKRKEKVKKEEKKRKEAQSKKVIPVTEPRTFDVPDRT